MHENLLQKKVQDRERMREWWGESKGVYKRVDGGQRVAAN